ncbi:MAG: NUDIX domain-containing protein [Nanoarchaeota archaeon]|nr:NUDIX domain-containing protein [Nanoarchaeota archaeon]
MAEQLPYRQGVQAYILHGEDVLLITDATNHSFWKPPSGGIEEGETPEQTLKREMQEELSVDVSIIKKCPFKNKFNWPPELIEIYHHRFQGQEQIIFITSIEDREKIRPDPTEIGLIKWVPFRELEKHLSIDQQKVMARKVYEEFLKQN